MVHLVRLHLLQQSRDPGAVREVSVVQENTGVGIVRITVEVVDALGVEGRGTTDDSVHHIALLQQQLREVGAVLAGDAGDERFLDSHLHSLPRGDADERITLRAPAEPANSPGWRSLLSLPASGHIRPICRLVSYGEAALT